MKAALNRGAEEIFVKLVNSRGPALKAMQVTLIEAGYLDEVNAISEIRRGDNWSHYALRLLRNAQLAA